ncbi:MAG: CcmD family protein [Planctomycetota bacterium]|jgi:CcmD family protein
MFYLCLAFTCLWLTTTAYVFILDRQVKDLTKRLGARLSTEGDQ